MRAVAMVLVAVVMVACGGSPEPGLDSHGNVVRQCDAMEGVYRVRLLDVTGNYQACPAGFSVTGLAFGTYAKPGEITYSADGCNVIARMTWDDSVYTYDLQVEPDGSTAHGSGRMVSDTCTIAFTAELVTQ